jgi:RNA polymerase sigma-70 factor (ECF subfamily)
MLNSEHNQMNSHKQQTPSLKKIEEEYVNDIFVDDDKMYKLKQIIDELDDLDKAILIVYADEGSMAKAGKKFNVSAATIYTNIKRIRNIIKEKVGRNGYI